MYIINKPNKTCHSNKSKEVPLVLKGNLLLLLFLKYVWGRESIVNFSYCVKNSLKSMYHAIPKADQRIEGRTPWEAGVQTQWFQWPAGSLQNVAAKGILTEVVLPEHEWLGLNPGKGNGNYFIRVVHGGDRKMPFPG